MIYGLVRCVRLRADSSLRATRDFQWKCQRRRPFGPRTRLFMHEEYRRQSGAPCRAPAVLQGQSYRPDLSRVQL